jgi:hypothetical protein
MAIGQELDDRGITTPAAIGAALGMPAHEATKLLTRHQWREGTGVGRLRGVSRARPSPAAAYAPMRTCQNRSVQEAASDSHGCSIPAISRPTSPCDADLRSWSALGAPHLA